MIERRVIVTWYTPEKKLPPKEWDCVICTFSGRSGEIHFDRAIDLLGFDEECGWFSDNYEFDELIVHAWADLEPYKG